MLKCDSCYFLIFMLILNMSWPRSHDSQSRDLGVTRSRYHETSLAKRPRASPRFRIGGMKVSPETFGPVYKVILHLTPLLVEQHELMTFESEPNAIHRTGGDYTPTKHRPSALGGERMRRPESKADELYITAQSVRQISWHGRSANGAVWA